MDEMEIGEIFSYSEIQQVRAFILANFNGNTLPDPTDIKGLLDRFSHETLTDKLEALIKKSES